MGCITRLCARTGERYVVKPLGSVRLYPPDDGYNDSCHVWPEGRGL
jgi:hypothetical protein